MKIKPGKRHSLNISFELVETVEYSELKDFIIEWLECGGGCRHVNDPLFNSLQKVRVKMPAGTKVAKAERAIKASAKKKGLKGKRADKYVYGTLNKVGLKKGNKTTKRGAQKA